MLCSWCCYYYCLLAVQDSKSLQSAAIPSLGTLHHLALCALYCISRCSCRTMCKYCDWWNEWTASMKRMSRVVISHDSFISLELSCKRSSSQLLYWSLCRQVRSHFHSQRMADEQSRYCCSRYCCSLLTLRSTNKRKEAIIKGANALTHLCLQNETQEKDL